MDHNRKKSSEVTCNSPFSGKKPPLPVVTGGDCARSKCTVRSKYSNNSKLTKSELYETLSKGKREKTGEKIKEREVEIEILTNSL